MGFLEGAEHSSGKQGQSAHSSLGTHHRQPTSLLQTTNIHMPQMNGLRRKERDRDSASLSKVITLVVGNNVLMFEHSLKTPAQPPCHGHPLNSAELTLVIEL